MNPILIDSHAHIYLNEFKDDIELIIEKSVSNNISKILMPNIQKAEIQLTARQGRKNEIGI